VPYRVDIVSPPPDALDVLVRLGALDVEPTGEGLAAILPDGVPPEAAADALGGVGVRVSAAVGRDDGSVWLLSPRAVQIGNVPLRLIDSGAFGTGHHPTTALCIEALDDMLSLEPVGSILDVGTGSGILALAALTLGVPQAVGLDIDAGALEIAAENARLNGLDGRLRLALGGPEAVEGTWPLVVANVLAAPLIEMAPAMVRRLGRRGRVILSGIPQTLEAEVWQAYQHLGLRRMESKTRNGWTAVIGQASW
jgi:ribosomal protein L11 methylase PrmA